MRIAVMYTTRSGQPIAYIDREGRVYDVKQGHTTASWAAKFTVPGDAVAFADMWMGGNSEYYAVVYLLPWVDREVEEEAIRAMQAQARGEVSP